MHTGLSPLPNWFTSDLSDQRLKWRRKFFLLPKRSDQSGKYIWLRKGWYGYRWITGPGEPIRLEYWMSDKEYMWFRINGK